MNRWARPARSLGFAAIAASMGLALLVGRPLVAQSGSLVARAELDATALSVLNVQDLRFGTVTPGLATNVDPRMSANAGKFEIHGARRAEIAVDLSLPPALTVGPWSMPIGFGANGACYRNRDQQNLCAYFDPSTTLVTNIRNQNFPNNLVVVWIGGTVSPAVAQFPGVYRGTITLTAAYTGN
jgi:hypothetical protein